MISLTSSSKSETVIYQRPESEYIVFRRRIIRPLAGLFYLYSCNQIRDEYRWEYCRGRPECLPERRRHASGSGEHICISDFTCKKTCKAYFFNIRPYKNCIQAPIIIEPVKTIPNAPVAQWIEHWIPNPCAASSILAGGTTIKSATYIMSKFAYKP